MTSRSKRATRGAALVEYVTLLSLIGVTAVAGVSVLGGKVKGTFDVVSDNLSSAEQSVAELSTGFENEADGQDEIAPGPVFSWKGDGTDALKPGVTATPDGWIIDIDSILDRSLYAGRLRYEAEISQSGKVTMVDASSPDWTSNFGMYVYAYWTQEDDGLISLVNDMDNVSPEGDLLAYKTTRGAYVPDDVSGIRLKRTFYCNSNSICDVGDFFFDINFYVSS